MGLRIVKTLLGDPAVRAARLAGYDGVPCAVCDSLRTISVTVDGQRRTVCEDCMEGGTERIVKWDKEQTRHLRQRLAVRTEKE